MSRIVNTIGVAPKQQVAPANNPAQQTQQAQQTAQKPKVTANNPFGLDDAAKIGAKIYKFANSGIWGGGGSAGNIGNASKISGGLNGLASAGIGFATVAIGENFFGGHGGTGAAIGSTIGAIWGPLGSAIGGLFGGAIGGMFGGDEKRGFVGISQGGGLTKQIGKYKKTFNTALGPVVVGVHNVPGEVQTKIGQAFQKSDSEVAKMFSEEQLARVKQGIKYGPVSTPYAGWGQPENSDRVDGAMKNAFKDRYALAVGGLDPNYYGTFKRVATDKNAGAVISTMAQLDKDISNKYGIFKDFEPQQTDPSQMIADNDIRMQRTIKVPVYGGAWYQAKEKETLNPQYDPNVVNQYKQQQASRRVVGYESYMRTEEAFRWAGGSQTHQVKDYRPVYENASTSVGNQALDFLAEKYDIGARPELPTLVNDSATHFSMGSGYSLGIDYAKSKANKAKMDSYSKKLAAWEKKVLDAYTDNYSQSVMMASADNLVTLSGGISRENTQPTQVTRPQPGLLNQANTPTWEGGVQTHAVAPVSNAATNASILRNRG